VKDVLMYLYNNKKYSTTWNYLRLIICLVWWWVVEYGLWCHWPLFNGL